MSNPKNIYDHPIYKYCEDLDKADALAWVFIDKDKLIKFPFKFPEIEPNEIRANVLYTGLCHSDSSIGRSHWDTPQYPICPGHEIVAQICQMGQKVKNFSLGEKVGFGVNRKNCNQCKFCIKGKECLCKNVSNEEKMTYGKYWGGWATQIQQPEDFFYKLPTKIDLKKVGPILCAGCTVYGPIKLFTNKGDHCAVIGIGGLGHFAILLLKKLGFHVTAFTHSKEKIEKIFKLGTDDVIMLTHDKSLEKFKENFDFIINTLPTVEYFNETLNMLEKEGKYIMVGIPSFYEELKIDFKKLIFGDNILIGSLNGNRTQTKELLNFCCNNELYPIIEEFSFEDFPKALEKLENCQAFFRCVVNVEDYSKKNGWFK